MHAEFYWTQRKPGGGGGMQQDRWRAETLHQSESEGRTCLKCLKQKNWFRSGPVYIQFLIMSTGFIREKSNTSPWIRSLIGQWRFKTGTMWRNLPSVFHKRRKSDVCFACQITPSFINPQFPCQHRVLFRCLTLSVWTNTFGNPAGCMPETRRCSGNSNQNTQRSLSRRPTGKLPVIHKNKRGDSRKRRDKLTCELFFAVKIKRSLNP